MKICSKCGENFENSTYRRIYCNKCRKAYDNEYYKNNKEKIKPRKIFCSKIIMNKNRKLMMEFLKDKKCVDCLESDPIVLDFDHLGDKNHSVSNMVKSNFNWNKILEEIKKCEIRCANCHRRKTAKEFNYYKSRG